MQINRTSQFWRRWLAVLAVPAVGLVLWAAETRAPVNPSEDARVKIQAQLDNGTNSPLLSPGQSDGRIAYVAAEMLAQNHYLRQRLDDKVSEKFYERYLESLDPQRLHFTQADLAEFDHYRDQLDDLTITAKRTGDVSPAFEIFNRFRLRLEQRVVFADQELKDGRFDFTTDERMQISRKDAPYPKDLAEARELWRQRLRYEYLQEKLAKLGAKKKPLVTTDESPAPGAAPGPTNQAPATVNKKTDAEDIVETLTRRYGRNLRFFAEWDHEDVMQVYLTALAHVYDPHSDYMNKIQADNFAIGMNNTLFGIGAELRSEDGYCTINRLVAGGPAEKSKKLKEKDRIVGVAQGEGTVVDVVEMSLNKVVQMIRGTKGTEVRLTIQPANQDASERFVLSLIRDEIKLEDQAAKAKVIEIPNGTETPLRLGIIDLPSFYFPIERGRERSPLLARGNTPAYGRYTSVDVAAFLKKFKAEKVSGVILDLRRNGGGSLEEAIKLTGLFIKEGPVVQVRNSEGDVFVDRDVDESVVYDGPLVVLTSRFSASASEILAGALQDYGRAVIVGDESTHGKGTVQNLNELGPWVKSTYDPGQLKVTIRKFYRASGASTQKKGVLPDVVLPSILNHSEDIGEASLDTALEWDEIKSARYDKLDLVEPYLGELLKRSAARTATNQDFVYIREDIEQYRKTQTDKTVSLNETERLKEKEETEARQKARDKERLARKDGDKKIYELALKQVDLPGLPPPVQKTNTVTATSSGAGFSTNSASAASVVVSGRVVPVTPLDDEDGEPKPPAVDATLEEAERILTDYISLLDEKNLAATRPATTRAE